MPHNEICSKPIELLKCFEPSLNKNFMLFWVVYKLAFYWKDFLFTGLDLIGWSSASVFGFPKPSLGGVNPGPILKYLPVFGSRQ